MRSALVSVAPLVCPAPHAAGAPLASSAAVASAALLACVVLGACSAPDAGSPDAGSPDAERQDAAGVPDDAAIPTDGSTAVPSGYAHIGLTPAGACAIRRDGTLACHVLPGAASSSLPPRDGTYVDVQPPCAIRSDGAIACWSSGSSDLGATAPSGAFVRLARGAGASGACAIRSDHTVACWSAADGWTGQAPPDRFTDLAVQHNTACGVREDDGAIVCWDAFCGGSLPCGSLATSTPLEGRFRSVRLSGSSASSGCALAEDGSIACWNASQPPPLGVHVAIERMDPVSSVYCAIRDDGSIGCWGSSAPQVTPPGGAYQEIGMGPAQCWFDAPGPHPIAWALGEDGTITRMEPVPGASTIGDWPPVLGRPFDAMSGLELSRMCLRREGGAWTCVASTSERPPYEGGTWADLAITPRGTCALAGASSLVECWELQYAATLPDRELASIEGRRDAFCGLTPDGAIACWGDASVASALLAPPSGTFTALSMSERVACALDETGTAQCWGSGPVAAAPTGTGHRAIAIAEDAGCVVRAGGDVLCWGSLGSAPAVAAPPGPHRAIAITQRGSDVLGCVARDADGSLACWGSAAHEIAGLEGVRARSVSQCGGGTAICVLTGEGDLVVIRRPTSGAAPVVAAWIAGA